MWLVTLANLCAIALAAFALTHAHALLFRHMGWKMPFAPELGYCYHCIGFWYSLILMLVDKWYINWPLAGVGAAYLIIFFVTAWMELRKSPESRIKRMQP